jgi:hypothetical protein
MAFGQGTAIINFGSGSGVNEASVAVTGQTTISATSKAEAYIMASDTTANHTANDHRYVNILAGFTCSTPTAGVGFTIYANSIHDLTGQFSVRWVWTD